MIFPKKSRREILEHEYQRHIKSYNEGRYQARQRIGPRSLSSAIESITRTRDALSEFPEIFSRNESVLSGIMMGLRQIKSDVQSTILGTQGLRDYYGSGLVPQQDKSRPEVIEPNEMNVPLTC